MQRIIHVVVRSLLELILIGLTILLLYGWYAPVKLGSQLPQ